MKPTLYAFDLDDTLIYSESKVELTRNGKTIELAPSEFAHYIKQSGDVLDFSQFQNILGQFDNIGIEDMLNFSTRKLQQSMVESGMHVAIVTARSQDTFSSLLDFFEFYFRYIKKFDYSTSKRLLSHIEYKGLEDPSPLAKKEHIEGYITGEKVDQIGIERVYFYDDSVDNVKAVDSLREEYPNTEIYTYAIRDGKPYKYTLM